MDSGLKQLDQAYGEQHRVAAAVIQRVVRRWLTLTKEGSIVFQGRGAVNVHAAARRGLPGWLEGMMDDTRRPVAESALADRLEGIIEEFTRKHVGQPQEAEIMHRLCGSQYMARRHPSVSPNPTALGRPFMSGADVAELETELRAGLVAHVKARADDMQLQRSDEWKQVVADALPVAMAHYRDGVVVPQIPPGTRPNKKREIRRAALRLELEALGAGLEKVLQRQPAQAESILATLRGRRLTPRMRRLLWRQRLASLEQLQAVSRKVERTRGDTARNQPIPALLGQMVSTALATSLQIYATTQARAQRLIESFGCLYLLCEDLTLPALRTALVVTMAMPAEPPEACAAMAHQILEQQAKQVNVTICEKAARAIMSSVARRNPALGKHLSQEPWRVVTEHMLLQWCTGAMVGVLQADGLFLIWDRCVQDQDWLKAVLFACTIVLQELSVPLLETQTASECQAILQTSPAELSATTLSKRLKELEAEGIGHRAKVRNQMSVTNMEQLRKQS
eukprot:COSAG02_NODE_2225_length_9457_cov_5.020945_4_plen_509_part_00